ncbi:MAG: M90 family metallopeptidase [Gemmatimonadota bacterium]
MDPFLLALAAAGTVGVVWLLSRLGRQWLGRRARGEAQLPIPPGWLAVVRDRLPSIAALPPVEQTELLHHARGLLTIFAWEGCGGLRLTEEMRLIIAAQAALLTWKRTEVPFPRLKTILVYPSTFRPAAGFQWVAVPDQQEEPPELGQSLASGTIVLAWDDVLRAAAAPHDGHNVVLHEFAHQLDSADGLADGVPTLPPAITPDSWEHALRHAYQQLARATDSGASSPIDRYGLTNRAEFFAVATESFFERPGDMRKAYPELYQRLAQFYLQDPAHLGDRRPGR